MQSLMSYGSSSVGSEESSPRKKKLKRIEHEESEVSSSVVEGDHSGLKARVTTESIESPAMKLLEMGCSSEQVAHAIRVCGRNTPVADVLDFIQAHQYHTVDIDGATNVPDPEDLERQLIEMGFLPEHIARALKACGKKSSIFEIADYIQAHYCVEDPSCSERNEVGRFGSGDQDGDGAATTLQRLLQMGFTPAVVQRASEECNSIDFDVLLEYLLDNKEGDLPTTLEPVRTEIKHPRAGFLKKMSTNSKAADEAGSSRKVSSAGKWTEDEVKLWYTYIGSKKKSTRFSESDGSDSETPGAAWEGKSGLKIKRGSKKICVLQSQREDISGPLSQGKMMGFGTPGHFIGRPRPLPNLMQGPPYFYFENVASVPKSEWDTIKLHFDGVDPEFTDSKFFSASRRPRGYVHNLPVEGRKLILPTPPMTIFEALPHTRKYWPCWDTRDKLNCINTRRASDSLCDRSRKLFTKYKGLEIPYDEQQNILQEFKKWNLVWVGPGQPAPLEPHEIELLLGFDLDHTRGCSTMTDRYEVLGNSFQVNTVAYHLSPLKSLYPQGITVLSLFSGIGGAEVALHKLGVFLKTVVAVEKNVKTRDAITSWWRKSGQRGDLILKDDVRELTNEVLSGLIDEIGSIDLIIGGSPCNNLSRNNGNSQVGLSGTDSSLFFEFPRILNIVKRIMGERGYMPKLF